MKHIEDTWFDKFKDEVRKLRVSITINGVETYSQPNNTYIVCPIVVINNNIPPCLSVKNEHLMLTFTILGR